MKLNNVFIEKLILKVNKLHPRLNSLVPPPIHRNGISVLTISRYPTGVHSVIDMHPKCNLNQLNINNFLYDFLEWIIKTIILLDSTYLKLSTSTSTYMILNLPVQLIKGVSDLLGPFNTERYHTTIPFNNSPLNFYKIFCHVQRRLFSQIT